MADNGTVDLGELHAILDEHTTDSENEAELQRLQGQLNTISKRRAELATEDKQLAQSARVIAGKIKKLGGNIATESTHQPTNTNDESKKPHVYYNLPDWLGLIGVLIATFAAWLFGASNVPFIGWGWSWAIGLALSILMFFVSLGKHKNTRPAILDVAVGVLLGAVTIWIVGGILAGITHFGSLAWAIGWLAGWVMFLVASHYSRKFINFRRK